MAYEIRMNPMNILVYDVDRKKWLTDEKFAWEKQNLNIFSLILQ